MMLKQILFVAQSRCLLDFLRRLANYEILEVCKDRNIAADKVCRPVRNPREIFNHFVVVWNLLSNQLKESRDFWHCGVTWTDQRGIYLNKMMKYERKTALAMWFSLRGFQLFLVHYMQKKRICSVTINSRKRKGIEQGKVVIVVVALKLTGTAFLRIFHQPIILIP